MFGFVRPLRGELKVREWERFQSVYCGLCHTIRRRYGFAQTLMLSYDCTYLALVLDALEPCGGEQSKCRCIMHPFRRRTCAKQSDGMIRAAAVSVILCWHKLADTVADERGIKKLAARLFRLFLRRGYRKAAEELPSFDRETRDCLENLNALERQKTPSLDRPADAFASLSRRFCGQRLQIGIQTAVFYRKCFTTWADGFILSMPAMTYKKILRPAATIRCCCAGR